MKLRSLAAVALIAGAALSQAAVFTYSLGSPTFTTTPNIAAVNTAGAAGRARAFYVSGNWGTPTGGAWSNEFRARIVGTTDQGNGVLDRILGGVGTGNPFVFGAPQTTTSISTFLADAATSDMGGTFNVGLRQTFGGSGATLSNASVSFVTDVVAPISVTLNANSPTFNRPDTLTTLATANYAYQATTFTAGATGSFHFGLYTGGVDGYLLGYLGAFNPAAPLTNLVSLNDDGSLGLVNSSNFWMNLNAGQQVTIVSTTFESVTSTAFVPMTNGVLTIAGPVPEPMTMGILALGALIAKRRKRNKKS